MDQILDTTATQAGYCYRCGFTPCLWKRRSYSGDVCADNAEPWTRAKWLARKLDPVFNDICEETGAGWSEAMALIREYTATREHGAR